MPAGGAGRFVRRRDRLMETLIGAGLMPVDRIVRKSLERLDPYALRKEALDRRLSPSEIGRALFHLNQRRGFKSNRIISDSDHDERSSMKQGIKRLEVELESAGVRTLGELLAERRLGPGGGSGPFPPGEERVQELVCVLSDPVDDRIGGRRDLDVAEKVAFGSSDRRAAAQDQTHHRRSASVEATGPGALHALFRGRAGSQGAPSLSALPHLSGRGFVAREGGAFRASPAPRRARSRRRLGAGLLCRCGFWWDRSLREASGQGGAFGRSPAQLRGGGRPPQGVRL